ncbi:hypothetical protein AB9E13_33545, partial [Rhizobium leguminosarum]
MPNPEYLMFSGTPPRHSKSADTPVTIDLAAQEFAAAADTEKPVDNETADAYSTAAADVGLPPETETASHVEDEEKPVMDAP